MDTRRLLSHLLVALALIALVAGLGPYAMQWIDRNRVESARRHALDQLRADEDATRRYVADHRDEILKRLETLQAEGKYFEAMGDAGKYVASKDPEILRQYRLAASEVSRQQTFAGYRTLVTEQCTETNARRLAADLLHPDVASPAPAEASQWKLTRLDAASLVPKIQSELRQWVAEAAAPRAPQGGGEELPETHRPRLHTQLIAQLLTDKPDLALLCVWKVEGRDTAGAGGKMATFELTLWLAPSVSGKMLEPGTVSLSVHG
jgi:hypothetical protein